MTGDLALARSTVSWLAGTSASIEDYLRLPQPSGTTPDWEQLDPAGQESCARDLYGLIDVDQEHLDWLEAPTPSLSQDSWHALIWAGRYYHSLLPFSDSERDWLLDTVEAGPAMSIVSEPLVEGVLDLQKQRGEVISNGQRKVVAGRELFRRWWAWRRGVDEFEGASTNELAKHALIQILTVIGPEPMGSFVER